MTYFFFMYQCGNLKMYQWLSIKNINSPTKILTGEADTIAKRV
ncbi:MAG: hypothetical protein AAF617_07835 [Bacteroidota bacterium]